MLKLNVEILGESILYTYTINGRVLSQRYFGRDESVDSIGRDIFDEIKLRGEDVLEDIRKAIKVDKLIRDSIEHTLWKNYFKERNNAKEDTNTSLSEKT